MLRGLGIRLLKYKPANILANATAKIGMTRMNFAPLQVHFLGQAFDYGVSIPLSHAKKSISLQKIGANQKVYMLSVVKTQ